MKKLGSIVQKTSEGLLIVKTVVKDPVKLMGSIVYDDNMRRIGVVHDVIGKVDEPFIVVKLDDRSISDTLEINSILYYYQVARRGRKRVGKGRG